MNPILHALVLLLSSKASASHNQSEVDECKTVITELKAYPFPTLDEMFKSFAEYREDELDGVPVPKLGDATMEALKEYTGGSPTVEELKQSIEDIANKQGVSTREVALDFVEGELQVPKRSDDLDQVHSEG